MSRSCATSARGGSCASTASTPTQAGGDHDSSAPTTLAALNAARTATAEGRSAERGTEAWLVHRWVDGRTDVSLKARQQYEWAVPHIQAGIGAIRLDRLERDKVTRWLAGLARAGHLSRRSMRVCRNVLRAALADAVDEGLLRRSPAARVPLPRDIANPGRQGATEAWTRDEVAQFLETAAEHRWAAGFRIAVLDGLRRSELLALRRDDVDLEAATRRIDEGLVPVVDGTVWTNAKSERSRHVIPLDPETVRALAHRRDQSVERLVAGPEWTNHDLILTTQLGHPVMPKGFDRTLDVVIAGPAYADSARTAFGAPQPRTWCRGRTTSVSCERSPTCSATAPRSLCASTPTPCPTACAPWPTALASVRHWRGEPPRGSPRRSRCLESVSAGSRRDLT